MTATLNAAERQSIRTAIEQIQRAVAHDQRGTLATALTLYCRGLDHLVLVLYSPRCTDRLRHILRAKCRQYLDRARALRETVRRNHGAFPGDNVDGERVEEEKEEEEEEAGGGEARGGGEEEKEALTDKDCEESVASSKQDNGGKQDQEDRKRTDLSSAKSVGECEENRHANLNRYSDERVLDQSNGTAALNCLGTEGSSTAISKKTPKRASNITEGRIPASITEILDRVLVYTDSGSPPQATCRWIEAKNVGVEEFEMSLKEILLLPALFPHLFNPSMFYSRRRLLLYSLSVDAVLAILQRFIRLCNTLTLITVSAHTLLTMAINGEETRLIWKALWSRARAAAPCAVCVTDLDVFRRDSTPEDNDHYSLDVIRKMTVELLVHLEGLTKMEELVIFIGVTSRPWLLDGRLLRRLDIRRFWPPPSSDQRSSVLLSALQGVQHTLSSGDVLRIVSLTDKFTRTGMEMLAEEAQARVKERVQEARFFRPVTGYGQRPTITVDENGRRRSEEERVRGVRFFKAMRGQREMETTPVDENRQRGSEDDDDEDDNAERGSDSSENFETAELSYSDLQRSSPSRRPHGDDQRSDHKTKTSFRVSLDPTVKYSPCDASDSDAVPMTWQEVGADQQLEPPLTRQDLLMALEDLQGQVDDRDWDRMTLWHEEYGQVATSTQSHRSRVATSTKATVPESLRQPKATVPESLRQPKPPFQSRYVNTKPPFQSRYVNPKPPNRKPLS
ncbi:hypothetical protein ACOMHN_017916 [Nucella lapillus]